MRFYKYPYLSMFIVGYYLFEHQGYYYRLRELLGHAEDEEVNYLIPLNRQSFTQLAKAQDRKFMLLMHPGDAQAPALTEMKKAAKKAKERKCSPVLFGEVNCSNEAEFCSELGRVHPTELIFVEKGQAKQALEGEIDKKKVLKFISRLQ
jgi:hypothetical protein